RSGRRLRDRGDRLRCGVWRKPPGAELPDGPRRGGDAIHVHAGGIGRHLRDHAAVLVVGPKLQFSPARHELGAQSQRAAELLGRGHGLLGGLTVDVKDAGKGENKVGTLRRRHVSFSQSANSKAATLLAKLGEPCEPGPTPDMTMLNAAPWSMARS